MVTTQELNGLSTFTYNLSDVRTMAGLEAVRGAVMSETNIKPIDGRVVLADREGSPHAEITFQQSVPLQVLVQGEAIGSLVTSREAETNLR